MSENIHIIRCTKEGCARITGGCIALSYTCVVHTKSYPKVVYTCSQSALPYHGNCIVSHHPILYIVFRVSGRQGEVHRNK